MSPTKSIISNRKLFPQTRGLMYSFEGVDRDGLPVSMETMGCRKKPLPGDDWGTTVGWSNKVEADLPWPGPLLGVRTPNDAVEGGRTPATAFRRGRVIWLKGRQKQEHTEITGNSITFMAGLGTDSSSHRLEISCCLSSREEIYRSVQKQRQHSTTPLLLRACPDLESAHGCMRRGGGGGPVVTADINSSSWS